MAREVDKRVSRGPFAGLWRDLRLLTRSVCTGLSECEAAGDYLIGPGFWRCLIFAGETACFGDILCQIGVPNLGRWLLSDGDGPSWGR